MIRALLALLLMTAGPSFGQNDAICGMGETRSAGCDAVRARPIVDAATAPWQRIGRVNFASTDLRSHCTGTLLDDTIVITAAHCLFNRPRKRWIPASSMRFVMGYQRGEYQGTANVLYYVLAGDQDIESNTLSPQRESDWALLVLDQPLTTKQTPVTGISPQPRIAGYPAIRPHVLSVAENCAPANQSGGNLLILTDCPIMQGDSGAPLFSIVNGQMNVLGIVSAVRSKGDNIEILVIPAQNWATARDVLKQ